MRARHAAPLLAAFLFVLGARGADAPAPAAPAPVDPSKAEGRFKNIQVFKGYPADDLVPAMQFITAALGVDCAYCHVDHEPEKDDKKHKLTARKMIAMNRAINRDTFDGQTEVTCMSCHRGSARPVDVPVIAMGEPAPEPDKIDGKDAVKVIATSEGTIPPAELWFDAQSGLVVRLMRYSAAPLGLNPTQIDYADFRAADGVTVPYKWTVARPSGRFTMQVDESTQNVPVDDKTFEKASQAAPS